MAKTTTTIESVMFRARDVAQLLDLSIPKIWKMHSMGQLPAPVNFGRATRWLRADLYAWLDAGMPDRVTFAKMQGGRR